MATPFRRWWSGLARQSWRSGATGARRVTHTERQGRKPMNRPTPRRLVMTPGGNRTVEVSHVSIRGSRPPARWRAGRSSTNLTVRGVRTATASTANATSPHLPRRVGALRDRVEALGPLLGADDDLAIAVDVFPLVEVDERRVVVQLGAHASGGPTLSVRQAPDFGNWNSGNMTLSAAISASASFTSVARASGSSVGRPLRASPTLPRCTSRSSSGR